MVLQPELFAPENRKEFIDQTHVFFDWFVTNSFWVSLLDPDLSYIHRTISFCKKVSMEAFLICFSCSESDSYNEHLLALLVMKNRNYYRSVNLKLIFNYQGAFNAKSTALLALS